MTLAEAARRFKALGAGPSRTTLSRDATADLLAKCKVVHAARARPRYRFSDLCLYYGVDPAAPAPWPRAAKIAALAPAPAPAAPEEMAAAQAAITQLAGEVGALRKVVEGFVRDLAEVRRTLQLKYDAENGLLRQRTDAADEKLRQAGGLDSLGREILAMRQSVNRIADHMMAAPK